MAQMDSYTVFVKAFENKMKNNLVTYLKSPKKNVLCVLTAETLSMTFQIHRLMNKLNSIYGASKNPRYFQPDNQLFLNWQWCVCEKTIDDFPDLTICEIPTNALNQIICKRILDSVKESCSKKVIFVLPEGPIFDFCLKEGGRSVQVFRYIPDVYSYVSVEEVADCITINIDQPSNQKFDTALHRGASEGNCAIVQRLMSAGADLNVKNIDGNTPLHLATLNGHYQVAETLLNQGAVIDAMNVEGLSALHIAVSKGQKNFVSLLLRFSAKETSTILDSGLLPLAALSGNINIISMLVNSGINVNRKNRKGETALYIAVSQGLVDVVNFLLSCGSNVNESYSDGVNPLYIAAREGHLCVAKLLLNKGAIVNDQTAHYYQHHDNITICYSSSLNIASQEGHHLIADILLRKGATITGIKYKSGVYNNPVIDAVKRGHKDVVLTLLKYIDFPLSAGMDSPMYFALLSGCLDFIYMLAEKTNPLWPSQTYGKNQNALHLAASKGHADVIDYLISLGVQPNVADIDKNTPLHLATKEGSEAAVKALLEGGADVNLLDQNNMLPLHIAAQSGFSNIVSILLKKGPGVNTTKCIETALRFARMCNREEVVKILLKWK